MKQMPFPIGISDFKEIATNYYYIDKTLLIRDFLDTIPKVSLFTRPRRFGKTLNMDMLRVFFEKTEEDTSCYFKDKKIWECGFSYTKHQGRYPVIFLTFKDVKMDNWKDTIQKLQNLFQIEFCRHPELADSTFCTEFERNYYQKIVRGEADTIELMQALSVFTSMLHAHHKTAPILIIDEYDTPIQQGYLYGYYEQVVLFMRNLFSGGLKDNPHLAYGFLTGILRVAKESIFSGMNNLKENSVLDQRYREYFGFTKEEIQALLTTYGQMDKYNELCAWYDGYVFGGKEIFNPWSVINYMDTGCIPEAFWQFTGSNDIIREIVAEATSEIQENLLSLLKGEAIAVYVDTSVIYPEIKYTPSSVYSFLLMAGYLKLQNAEAYDDNNMIYEVAIPNKEIRLVYEKEILSALSGSISQSTAISIQQALARQNIPEFQKQLSQFLKQTISTFDAASESFYHGLLLGIYAVMNHQYEVTSNREAGDGRYDIQLCPYHQRLPGILLELKVLRERAVSSENLSEKLQKLAKEALAQIQEMDYESELHNRGITQVMKIGIAFYKKQVELISAI